MNSTQEVFQFFSAPPEIVNEQPTGKKLFLVPTSHGEIFDPGFAPMPSDPADLPEPERWTLAYVVSVIEILLGRRQLRQIARMTHRYTFNSIASQVGKLKVQPKIKKIHRSYPIAGVIEVVVTLVFPERVRALIARFEGVDGRWLCTELDLL
jgi:hypothetical protein